MPQAKKDGSGSGSRASRSSSGASRSSGRAASASSSKAGAAKRPKPPKPPKPPKAKPTQSSSPADASAEPRVDLSAFSDFVLRGMEGPLHLVMLTNERIQEIMDDAVERGRMTRHDGEALVQEMVRRGRQQTADVLADFEALIERAQEQFGTAASAARRSPPADRVLREVDRARRGAGIGQAFPILAYDELTAAQIAERLDDLSPAELRKVRDYERRHGNRKSVLQTIESKLG